MKVNRDDLIEKVANNLTDGADWDTLTDYFRDGQIAWLEDLTNKDLIAYANEFLGYDVEEEGI